MNMHIIMVTSVAIALTVVAYVQSAERLQGIQEHSEGEVVVEEKEILDPAPEPELEIEEVIQEEPELERITVVATAYVSDCQGCIGITKGGTDVRNTIYHESGNQIIATDPSIIPLGSLVEIDGQRFIADDIGGAIKGHRIDILMGSKSQALEFGVKEVDVTILRRGE